MTVRRILRAAEAPLIAAVAALLVSSIALLIAGDNPITAFQEMWKTIDSTESVVIIINKAVPFYVAGVAVAIGFKMNLFNIGADGQYRLGALFAAAVGAAIDLPAPLHVLVICLTAMFVAAMWAAIAGVLKVTRNVNEVISTIMLNYIATGISAFLLIENDFFRNRNAASLAAETKPLPKSARLPPMNEFIELFGFNFAPGVVLHGFLPYAILLGIGYHLMLNRSRFGFELRTSGLNAPAAQSAGVNPKAMVLKAIILSGAIAGLIGMSNLLADPQFGKFGDQFPKTLGFTGLALALLGRNHPVGIAAAALVWATIERATQRLSLLGIPQEVGLIMQGSFLLAAVIAYEVMNRRNLEATARDAARRSAAAHGAERSGVPA